MVERFYEYVLSFPETAALLEDKDLLKRLMRAQRAHFVSMVGGDYGDDYFESRVRVGLAHAEIGIEPKWYFGAYAAQVRYVIGRVIRTYGADPEKVDRYLGALIKVFLLDICLATDAYIFGGFVEKALAEAHAREAERATRALAEKQEEAERREDLVRMIVHDLRSPVTAIVAAMSAGMRRYSDTEASPGRHFALAEESARNALGIIDDIMKASRAPGGDIPVNRQTFDVVQLVKDSVDELRPFAAQSSHVLSVAGADTIRTSVLDSVLVRRVVSNLLVNAFRHTPAGCHVDVLCEVAEGRCTVVVSDDGPGIPRSVRERIWPAKGEFLGAAAQVGTGLGLPFCKMACHALDGAITLADSPSGGARIVIDLPIE
jgi:signal transduction histidine kinase